MEQASRASRAAFSNPPLLICEQWALGILFCLPLPYLTLPRLVASHQALCRGKTRDPPRLAKLMVFLRKWKESIGVGLGLIKDDEAVRIG